MAPLTIVVVGAVIKLLVGRPVRYAARAVLHLVATCRRLRALCCANWGN
jgi:hypothetical protein